MNLELISVIVPVYNVEKYLDRCLLSIIRQTYSNLEIILVDDGSTDKSGSMCEMYAKTDKRIRVIHQKNQGQSVARNTGLDVCTGKVISFIDSDDFICEGFYERLMTLMYENDADIVQCDWIRGKANKIEKIVQGQIKMYSGVECYLNYFTEKAIPYIECPTNKIYRKELFENTRFIEGRLHEDLAIMHYIFEKAKRVVYVNEKMYYYYMSTNSTLRGNFSVNKLSSVLSYEERLDFFYKIGGEELWGRALQQYEAILFKYYYLARKYCKEYPSESEVLLDKIRTTYVQLSQRKNISYVVRIFAKYGVVHPYLVGKLCSILI